MTAPRPWLPLLVALGATIASPAAGAPAAPDTVGRFVFTQVILDREPRRFAVWLPPGHASRRSWPAILFLHGAGECGSDGRRPTEIGLGPELAQHPERWPFVVVFPQKPLEQEEWEERESLVLAVLERATKDYGIDKARVALGGMSQGGHGTWALGARHPRRWTCLVPICGYGRGDRIAPRVAALPIWAFHGLRDDVVDPNETRLIMAAVRTEQERLGLGAVDARLTLYEDANHNSWDAALDEPELPGWILGAAATR